MWADTAQLQLVRVTKKLTIEGGYSIDNWTTSDPVERRTILDAGFGGRVVDNAGATLTLRNLNITRGIGEDGAGIRNSGTLTVTNCSVYDNKGNQGGGLYNDGKAMIEASAIYSNTAPWGGGFYNSAGMLRVVNSTIFENTAAAGGGGGVSSGGTAAIVASTLAANSLVTDAVPPARPRRIR